MDVITTEQMEADLSKAFNLAVFFGVDDAGYDNNESHEASAKSLNAAASLGWSLLEIKKINGTTTPEFLSSMEKVLGSSFSLAVRMAKEDSAYPNNASHSAMGSYLQAAANLSPLLLEVKKLNGTVPAQ